MSNMKDEIIDLRKRLEKADEENKNDESITILQSLQKYQMNVNLLKDTRIGKVVGKMRKHQISEIANLSNGLVASWKKTVETKGTDSPTTQSKDDGKKRKKEEDSKPQKPKKEETKKKSKKEEDEDSYRPSKPSRSSNSSGGDDDMRKKIVDLLIQALSPKKEEDRLDIDDMARDIESELFRLYPDCGRDYKAKFRSLSFNLKNPKNPDLRDSIMGGILAPNKLVVMSSQDMASEELKKERERIAQYHMEAAQLKMGNQTSTDMFKCGKCGKRETTYYQLQTRSADEPMTTFHTCTACGHRWKS